MIDAVAVRNFLTFLQDPNSKGKFFIDFDALKDFKANMLSQTVKDPCKLQEKLAAAAKNFRTYTSDEELLKISQFKAAAAYDGDAKTLTDSEIGAVLASYALTPDSATFLNDDGTVTFINVTGGKKIDNKSAEAANVHQAGRAKTFYGMGGCNKSAAQIKE